MRKVSLKSVIYKEGEKRNRNLNVKSIKKKNKRNEKSESKTEAMKFKEKQIKPMITNNQSVKQSIIYLHFLFPFVADLVAGWLPLIPNGESSCGINTRYETL